MPMREASRCEPVELFLAGEVGLYRDAPHRDLNARLVRIAPSLAVEDKALILNECHGDRLLSWIVQGMHRAAMRRVTLQRNPVLADQRFLDQTFHAFLSIQRTMQRIEAGEYHCSADAWLTYKDLYEIAAVYLALAGYLPARKPMLEMMWGMARTPGYVGGMIGRRAFGFNVMTPEDWPERLPGVAYPNMLQHADAMADGLLLRGVAEPRREIHDDGIDNDRAGVNRVAPGPELDRLIRQQREDSEEIPASVPGVVVFPKSILATIGKPENGRDVKAILGDALGRELPLIPVPEDWNAWERARLAAFPWATKAIRAFRNAQAGRTHFGLAVLCLHGSPGAGKSALARELAESVGLRFVRYQADASSENSYSGTSVRWQSGHLGILEAALASERKASVLVSIDEIEKAGGTRKSNGGTLHDCLHGAFERETAKSWTSPFLLHAVDISHAVYVCTANEPSSIPSSLKDRMTLVEVPEPGPEHLAVLAPRIARELCREQGLHEAYATLDAFETECLQRTWQGGSIRHLKTCLEVVFRARDEAPIPTGMMN